MAGDWMKVEHSTPDKPEVLAIAARMGITPDQSFGICFRMWRWFDQHTESGNARGVTPALLNQLLGVTGFAEAAIIEQWLVTTETGLSLPNFDRHNGKTAKARALTYSRVASHRGKMKRNSNARGVTPALPENREQRTDIPPPQPSTVASEEEEDAIGCLVKELRAKPFCVNDAKTAIRTALSAGVTVGEIKAIAGHYLAMDNWSPAQLHYRICNAVHGESSADNWPTPDHAKTKKRYTGTGDAETNQATEDFKRREAARKAGIA